MLNDIDSRCFIPGRATCCQIVISGRGAEFF